MCVVCVACLLILLYPFVWLADVSLVFLHSPLFLSSPIDVDAMALCQAAGSLKKLKLKVFKSCPSEALVVVFDHRPLEELSLALYSDVAVSSACSPPGM